MSETEKKNYRGSICCAGDSVTNVFVDRKLSRSRRRGKFSINKNMSETEKKLSEINSAAWEIR
ncbi:hypothetical protein NQ317_003845 [Molorchus minor]|uniref:Uncharacterized protein n=1 Tax=Molorchus minor TaxID=1323400 RepID=A0ABQ9J031_9CUCU|nr:hypothetical protein NQ317_003845 [Molorchus minor]